MKNIINLNLYPKKKSVLEKCEIVKFVKFLNKVDENILSVS